ncbi:MAG: hypothetical protein PHR47_02295 [Candidatus Pacebacteria bacterium]|nr:hypothetical protein [Candidatus Paceibacterota bacterium]
MNKDFLIKCLLIVALLMAAAILATATVLDENEIPENVISYGNGVYYINCVNPEGISQEKNFGYMLSNLIEENRDMETDIIVPYQEGNYTKGYYVIFQKI